MSSVTLRAHYDGKHIIPDEASDLPVGVPLFVTVVAPDNSAEKDQEREAWTSASVQSLARAYSDDEPEYTVADLKS